MAHETPTITAEIRDHTGTRNSRRLRQSGRLPGVIYGHKTEPLSVSVDEKELLRIVAHGAHLVSVNLGGQSEHCLVKDLQYGYLGDNLIHIDFARVDLDELVTVNVHLRFVGEPAEAKRPGAIVNHALTELEVECRVADIPDEIRVDLARFQSNVTVGQITLPEGIRTRLDPGTPIVTISFLHVEEAAGEAVVVEGSAEPEVISETKAKAAAAEKEKDKSKE